MENVKKNLKNFTFVVLFILALFVNVDVNFGSYNTAFFEKETRKEISDKAVSTETIQEVEVIEVEKIVVEKHILYQGISESDAYNLIYNVMLYFEEPNPKDYTALLIAVGKAESNFIHLKQKGNGIARSFFQIEPATHQCVFDNYLKYRPELMKKVLALKNDVEIEGLDNLSYNLAYATAIAYMCLKRYISIPPDKDDKLEQAKLHKKYYNTSKGKATVENTLAKI